MLLVLERVAGSLEDLSFATFDFDTTYTSHKLGAHFMRDVGTSELLNALKLTWKNTTTKAVPIAQHS